MILATLILGLYGLQTRSKNAARAPSPVVSAQEMNVQRCAGDSSEGLLSVSMYHGPKLWCAARLTLTPVSHSPSPRAKATTPLCCRPMRCAAPNQKVQNSRSHAG